MYIYISTCFEYFTNDVHLHQHLFWVLYKRTLLLYAHNPPFNVKDSHPHNHRNMSLLQCQSPWSWRWQGGWRAGWWATHTPCCAGSCWGSSWTWCSHWGWRSSHHNLSAAFTHSTSNPIRPITNTRAVSSRGWRLGQGVLGQKTSVWRSPHGRATSNPHEVDSLAPQPNRDCNVTTKVQ